MHEYEETYSCSNTLILGDFNLNATAGEVKNRNFSNQEKRIANVVKNLRQAARLEDIWQESSSFTWRRPNTECFSTIDRILYSKASLQKLFVKANWSLSFSDHAAVESGFNFANKALKTRTKISRIDPSIVKNSELSLKLTLGIQEMIEGIPTHWDPHMRLEFLKVCIRTVAEKLQAERKRKEKTTEEEINEELNAAINVLGRDEGIIGSREGLINYVEELRTRKSILIEEKGARLAERLGTKWYNEGKNPLDTS